MLFGVTIAILVTFLSELLLVMYLLGPGTFCRQTVYVVDISVVSASLVLEVLFHFASNREMWALPGILILFRTWRFVRVGHGLVMSTYEVMEHNVQLATEHIGALEERLRECGDEVPPRPERLRKDGPLNEE